MASVQSNTTEWTVDEILEGVLQVSRSLPIKNTMPKLAQIKEYYGDTDLIVAIRKNNLHIKQIAEKLNLKMSTAKLHSMQWDKNSILNAVLEVSKSLSPSNTMPTFKQMEAYYGNGSLTSAISSRKWSSFDIAKQLNLTMQYSETIIGQSYEIIVQNKLIESGYVVNTTPTRFPYDLFVNNCVKIEVKTSHIFTSKNGSFFTFAINKPFITSDIYILCCVHDEDDVVYYVVPSVVIPYNKQISIGMENSKYNTFINRFDIIDEYVQMYSNITEKYDFNKSNC